MRSRSLLLLLATALLTAMAVPASAATPPLVPFDSTADLLVMDDGCVCIVEIAEDATIRIVATTGDVASADTDAAGVADVDFNESGIAVAADGTAFFVNTSTSSILTLGPDDALGLLVSGSDIEADTGSSGVDLEKIAFSPDGSTIYGTDESNDDVLAIDSTTGAASILAAESTFEALPDVTSLDLEGGTAVDASGTIYVTSDGTPDAVFAVQPDGTPSLLASEPNEVQSVVTTAPGGTFTLTFDGQETSTIAFDASAADVQSALETLSNIDPGDVAVRGEGSTTAPWIVTFTGQYAATDVSQMAADGTGLTGGSVTVGTEVVGASFDDLDLWATFDGDGLLVVTDDSPATLFQITPAGEVTALFTDIEFENNGDDDPEGGIAYDENGVLYIAEDDSDTIYTFDNGVLSVAYSEATLQSVTGTSELDGGIAFRMPIVDISPTITAPGEAVAGDTITYTIAVTNNGDDTLDALTLDTGAGLEGVTVSVDSGSISGTTWTGDLAPGDTATISVEGTVPSGATGTLDLAATTTAALGAVDTDTTNDSDTASVTITTSADLAITADAPDSLAVEGSADLTLTVTNNGPSDATDVVVTDTLPEGTVLEASTADDFTCEETDGIVTCTQDSLAAGASATITLRVTTAELDCSQAGVGAEVECSFDGTTLDELVNEAAVTSATIDPVGANNSASNTIVLDTSDVEVDLPAAGATTGQLALLGLGSMLLGLVLLARTSRATRRRPAAA